MKIERSLKTFFGLILALIISLTILDFLWSRNIVRNITEQVCINNSEQTESLTENTFKGLEVLVQDFASDPKIIELIEADNNYSEKEEEIKKSIRHAQGLLTATSFVESIDVVDSRADELYSSKGDYAKFNMESRPWFKEAYEETLKGKNVIITSIHKDLYNNRETVSIISFIKNEKGDIIGCVLVNAYMDAFTEYMEKLYEQNGGVTIYVELPDGEYYNHKEGIRTFEEINENNEEIVVKRKNLVFDFDKKNTLIYKVMNDVNRSNELMLLIFILFTIFSFEIIKRKALNPLLNNISKLKKLLKQLNEYDEKEFEDKKGFNQLDFIVNAFDSAINEKAREYILFDPLTKIPNRKGLEEIFHKEVEREKSFALIFIDLNKFKNINDVYGHWVGDSFLKVFAEKLSKAIGKRGTLARISGDEFIILYKNFLNNKELEGFYEKNILGTFKDKKFLNYNLEVSFSAGVAIYPRDGKDFKTLMKKSDYMMYTNKKKGVFDKLAFFDYKVYKEIERKDTISMELSKAIDENEFFMVYQPIVDKNKKVRKLEALIRWNSKNLGFVPPMEFISVAENNRDIIKLGDWIFNTVCFEVKELIKKNKDLVVNINVSSIQLLEKDFAYKVKEIVEKNGIRCENICIEITESVMIEEEEASIRNLNLLKLLGFKLSLDDFGTGYTSFSYLKKFKGGSLKIDKSILDDADQNEYGIINSIKDIGHELNFKIVVEGVETKEQFESLVEIGCDLFQGYYFSKPISLDEVKNFIGDKIN
ncbi:EAL domain-containing protein [Clostridium sp. LIBA-8841]|uniref:bifunctional diguanylate cyclase/phosphodiesterase n=1 Tax=Clostridium sp. LIBA-8841 TaxID=2987530 RepID=UPI002AC3792B|nr:EAL domain-containing protein [Clostridium sp. LIBA-8841]MDZ5253782.1 EAL domain-containing protein [Clostridium sp. LIBA-8841]